MIAAPDYIEPLEAWRVWHVVDTAGSARLRSVIKPAVWQPGEALAAECLRQRFLPRFRRRTHKSPAADCDCGIYATSLERIDQYVREGLSAGAAARAVGRVKLWGSVVECERGYRAEFAYPLDLFVPRDEALAEELADAYGIPVRVVGALTRELLPS